MSDNEDEGPVNFNEMGLDERLVKAISRLGWSEPTAIQEQAIPFALKGKFTLSHFLQDQGVHQRSCV